MKLKLSVVTICYNSYATLERTFLSVLSQSQLPYEYIVIDGASNDGSLDIIQKYEKLFTDRNVLFKYISEVDAGLYDAMNKALILVTGEWVHYLNSDDLYYSNDVIRNVSDRLCTTNKDIVTGNLVVYSGFKKIKCTHPTFVPRRIAMYFTCPFQQPATFVKTQIMKVFQFDITYRNSADYKLWVILILNGVSHEYINENITIFNTGGASSNLKNMNDENIRFFKELNLFIGEFIHRCYIHMYLLSYLKEINPSFYLKIKRLFGKV